MTNESHTDWWNQYLKSDDPDHVVVQMDKEIELLRDQRDSNMAKEVERIASLTTQRDEYKVWWERDSTSLGKALNEVSSLRAVREESRAAIEQLHAAVKTAQELAATRLMEIEKLQMRLKRHEPVSLYNGHDIDWWKAEAERLRGALQTILDFSDLEMGDGDGARDVARAALGAHAHEPSEQRSEETGWLIELAIKGIPHWLMVSSDREWTTDSNEALRFAREQDAEAMLYHSGLEGAKATGHTWCDPLPNKGAQEIGLCPHGMPRAMSECLPCVGANALEAARRATIPITPDELCPRCGRYMRVQLMGRSVCPICPGG